MNKKIVLTIFFVVVIVFSISSIQAQDVNITDSNITDTCCDSEFKLENYHAEDLESANSNNLSTNDRDNVLNEAIKNQTELTSQSTDIYYSGSYQLILKDSNSTIPLVNKEVTLIINNIGYNVQTDDDGIANFNIKLNPGKYDVFAYFKGDETYESSNNFTSTVNILPTIKAYDVSKYYKASTQYTATFFDSQGNALANRNVNINVNGKNYNKKTDSRGVVSLAVDLKPGTYKVISTDPITGYKLTTSFRILPTIISNDIRILLKDSKKFTAKFLKSNGKVLAKKWIKFKLNGKIYKVKTNSNGQASLSLKKLKKGTYNVVCYNNDGFSKTYKIKVYNQKAVTRLYAKHYTFGLNDAKKVRVKFTTSWGEDTSIGKIIRIKINGKTYTGQTDDAGWAYINLPSLQKGLYSVQYYFIGDKYFNSVLVPDFITIFDNTDTKLSVKSTTRFGHGAGTPLKIYYSTKDGVPLIKRSITVSVNGMDYGLATDDKGFAYLPINLNVGEYVVNYKSTGDSIFKSSNGSCKIEVFNRFASKITWKSGNSFKDSSQTFKVLLTDSNGHPISNQKVKLTIDGETYVAVTSSGGYATFKTSVALGKYKISFKFEGNNDYLSCANSKHVKVKLSKFKNGINQKNTLSKLKVFLKSSKHCKVGNGKIKKLVKHLTKGLTSKIDKAKAIFNYVRDNLDYSYYYDTKYGAVTTLKLKKGNCVDHSHLLVAMFRTAGLKARYVHGTCKFSDGDFTGHVWTQVLIGKNWICADAISYKNSLGKIANWDTKHYTLHAKYSSLPF